MVDLTQRVVDLTHKINELESISAFQESSIESLTDTVVKQHQDIQHLQTQLRLLSEFIKNVKSDMDSGIKHSSEETRPPHY